MIETIKVWSEKLNSDTLLKVVRPDKKEINRLMILLHGKLTPEMNTEQFDLIPEELALEELCNKYGMIVVIPLMKNRYYISENNYNCEEFVALELPNLVRDRYGIWVWGERIIAGISMGGYGATLIAANTGVFQKVISISGSYISYDIEIGNPEVWGDLTPNCKKIEGTFLQSFVPLESLKGNPNKDVLTALKLLDYGKPVIVATCGTADWLYSRNLQFKAELEKNKLKYGFIPLENGKHESECFREGLWKAMEYLENVDIEDIWSILDSRLDEILD